MKKISESELEVLIDDRLSGKSFDAIRKGLLEKNDYSEGEIRRVMNAISDYELEQTKIKDNRKYQLIAMIGGTLLFMIGGAIHLYRYIQRIPYTREDLIIPFGLMTLGYFMFRKSWRGYKAYEKID